MTAEGEEPERLTEGGVFGTYDVRDFERRHLWSPLPGRVILTSVPGWEVGREDGKGFLVVLGQTLAYDGSFLV